jgi:hypothetical protein
MVVKDARFTFDSTTTPNLEADKKNMQKTLVL